MTPFWAAVCLLLAFISFLLAAAGVRPIRYTSSWLPIGLAFWVLVPLWAAVAAAH